MLTLLRKRIERLTCQRFLWSDEMSFALYTYISSVRYEQLEFSMLSCLRCDILVTVNTDVFKTIWGTSPPIFEHDEHLLEEGNLIVVGRKQMQIY